MRYCRKQQNTLATNQTLSLSLHQMGMDPLQRRCTTGSPTFSNRPIAITITHNNHLLLLLILLNLLSLHVSIILESPASKPSPLLHLTRRGSSLPIRGEPSRLLRRRRRILRRILLLFRRRGTSWSPLTGERYRLRHARGRGSRQGMLFRRERKLASTGSSKSREFCFRKSREESYMLQMRKSCFLGLPTVSEN